MHSSRSEPGLSPWHHEMKDHVKGRVKELVLGRTGASWEDRLQEQKARKVQAMKIIEKEQRETIKAATDKGIEKQQVYSPLLALRSAPLLSTSEKQAQRLEERRRDMENKTRSYHIQRSKILAVDDFVRLDHRRYGGSAPPVFPEESASTNAPGAGDGLGDKAKGKAKKEELEQLPCNPGIVILKSSEKITQQGLKALVSLAEMVYLVAFGGSFKAVAMAGVVRDSEVSLEIDSSRPAPFAACPRAGLPGLPECNHTRLRAHMRWLEEKMRTRDPLFKVEDVSAAKVALADARRKKQAELQAEEKKRWEHLEECAAKGCHKRQTLYDLHNSPSFDERLAKAVEQKTKELKDLEKAQKDRIREAVEAGHNKSAAVSPLSACLRNPPDNMERQREILEERNRTMATAAREYLRKRDEMVERQRKREPLFSGAAVADATTQLEEKARKLKQEMAAEQLKNRQHILELQNKVLARPMMMEIKYGIAAWLRIVLIVLQSHRPADALKGHRGTKQTKIRVVVKKRERHILAQHPREGLAPKRKSYKCTGCEETFGSFLDMVRHRREKHPKTYSCDECDFVAGKRDQLNHHKAMVHRQRLKADPVRSERSAVKPWRCRVGRLGGEDGARLEDQPEESGHRLH
ncbi:hypothetical protein AK812_SmicGene38600 [Symbiodinium microadriaticum]|uniref:C2H2-type domain-containing protein n=1 Tax=Symbiodinium microadriaticum TaxID=2951 RepID=A0A1Q9CDC2_SYMMI|nr:hypothetical protein AK812_SmicGene38600 [Symbiodinium microadriaticum]